MTGQLITFPVRLYVRGARVLVHAAEDVTGKALMGSLRVAGLLGGLRPGAHDAEPPPPAPSAPRRPVSPVRAVSPAPNRAPRRPRAAAHGTTERRNGSAAPTPPAPPQRDTDTGTPLASGRLAQDGVAASIDLDTPTPPAPAHVSTEPVLVREEAEAGAQDGAGASISVQAPWAGYEKLSARDVVARLTAVSTAELAAVQLYESTHRKRQTVIAAAARELAKPQR